VARKGVQSACPLAMGLTARCALKPLAQNKAKKMAKKSVAVASKRPPMAGHPAKGEISVIVISASTEADAKIWAMENMPGDERHADMECIGAEKIENVWLVHFRKAKTKKGNK